MNRNNHLLPFDEFLRKAVRDRYLEHDLLTQAPERLSRKSIAEGHDRHLDEVIYNSHLLLQAAFTCAPTNSRSFVF